MALCFSIECTFTLAGTSGTALLPLTAIPPRSELTCIWKVKAPPYHEITFQISRIFRNQLCDCSCGSLSFNGEDGMHIREFCPRDLPATFRTTRRIHAVRLNTSSLKGMEQGPLFVYHMWTKKSILMEAMNYIRVRRESESKVKAGESNASVEVSNVGPSRDDSVSSNGERNRFTRLPVILPAVLTVVIFVVCVIFIAAKMYNAEEFPYDR